MTQLLVLAGIVVIVGFALYCMVCERIDAHRRREPAPPARRPDTTTLPETTPAQLAPILQRVEV